MTLSALSIGIFFSYPVHSAHLAYDIQRLLLWGLFALPAYALLIWSAEYRAQKRLLESYPELNISSDKSTPEVP